MQASTFPPQALALPGHHYQSYGRFCALPSRYRALGGTATVSYRVRGHWSAPRRYPVWDICGTPGRVDFPCGTFLRLFGRDALRRGLIPIRLLHVSRPHKRTHHRRHGQ